MLFPERIKLSAKWLSGRLGWWSQFQTNAETSTPVRLAVNFRPILRSSLRKREFGPVAEEVSL